MEVTNGINKLIEILEKIYNSNNVVLVEIGDNYKNFFTNIRKDMYGNMDFNKYPVRFIRNTKYHIPSIKMLFSCYNGLNDEMFIEYNKDIKIDLHIQNIEKVKTTYNDIFLTWVNKFKKPLNKEPLEFDWCLPPDDINDVHYDEWMNKWVKFCNENPEFVEHNLSEEHKIILAKYRKRA